MIQLTRAGCRPDLSPEQVEDLRRRFERDHYVVLPGLLEKCLLDSTLELLESAEFGPLEGAHMYKCTYNGLELKDPKLSVRLSFLFNDEPLFELVRRIAGCPPIKDFVGRVIKMLPERGHFFDWHTDGLENYFQTRRHFDATQALRVARRVVALRLNLSRDPYEGGRLQFRRPEDPSAVTECADAACGNVILFKTRGVAHRNSEVRSGVRTTFSGFFLGADPVEPVRAPGV